MSIMKLKNRFFLMNNRGNEGFSTLNFAVGEAIDHFNPDGKTDDGETELYVVEVRKVVKPAKTPIEVFTVVP